MTRRSSARQAARKPINGDSAAGADGSESPPQWEKVLWKKQPFPDNYVPPSFLAELKSLPPRPRPRLIPLVLATLPISQHLSTIALFLAIFHRLLVGAASPTAVVWSCVVAAGLGYFFRHVGWGVKSRADPSLLSLPSASPLRPLLLPPLLLALLSPVLGTLTSATTSDTIWPLSGGLFFVHLLLADFSTGPDLRKRRLAERRKRAGSVGKVAQLEEAIDEKSLSSSLSLTSALSASVVLASRLPSTAHVFSLVLLAVGLFAGWPTIAKGVREAGTPFSLMLTLSTTFLALSLFPSFGTEDQLLPSGPALVFLSILLLVNILGPAMLWWGWRFKTRRGGGWDAAVVKVRSRAGQG